MSGDQRATATESYEAGDFRRAREAALAALEGSPEDVELLRLAGRAGVELGEESAVEELKRVSELAPDDAASWHDLGDALASEGRSGEARTAFERALEIDPDDADALAHVGHAAAAAGSREDAISYLSKAAERGADSRAGSSAVISLVDMYRTAGEPEQALEAAKQVAGQRPDDVIAQLDIAELALELDRLDDAAAAFERLREVDDVDEHEVYAMHGLALVAMKRGDAQAALGIAREALVIDELGRSAELVLHLEVETGSEADPARAGRPSAAIDRVPATRDEIEQSLATGMTEHRRAHIDDPRLGGAAGG